MKTEMEYSELTPIQGFFRGRAVFLTGVTGVVGKVLLEKLLRCCPGIGIIYLLMRPKKGLSTEERFDKLFKLELFKKLKEVYPNFREKVSIVEGDITKDRLGISDEDFEKLQANVSIIFHSAASVQFNDPLKIAAEHNIVATLKVIQMAHQMPNIAAVVHVSTAYVRREEDCTVLERIPKCKVTPKQLLNALSWMDEKAQKAVTDFLLEGKLTTYLVTKALAEVVVQEEQGDLPVAIVRPCYVAPTCRDPFPGWMDSIQGLSGLLLAGAKGVLRTLLSVEGLKINVIPVDFVINTVITSAWYVGTERPSSVYVVNCVMDYDKLPLADQDILDYALTKREEYPLVNVFRYPHFTVYHNRLAYMLHSLIDEWIPAIIIDFILFIFTGRTILVKVYRKINFLYGIFYRLGKDPWICKIENYNALAKRLSNEDSEIFFMETDGFNWTHYIDNCFLGGRKFLAHEDPSNIPYAKKKAKIWWTVTTIIKWCFILFLCYYFTRPFFRFYYNLPQERMYTLQ